MVANVAVAATSKARYKRTESRRPFYGGHRLYDRSPDVVRVARVGEPPAAHIMAE